MKIALCLSGFCEKTFTISHIIKNNIIEPNNADVFIHTWSNDEKTLENLISEYKPKKYLIEDIKNFKNKDIILSEENYKRFFHFIPNKEEANIKITNNSYSMWYGIHMSILQKELYSLENDFKYDFVFRLRFDVCPNTPIVCENFDKNKLYYLNLNQPYNMISDWFGLGGNNIMNIYGNTFFLIEEAYNYLVNNEKENDKYWCNELFLKYNINKNKIKHEKILSDNVTWGVKI